MTLFKGALSILAALSLFGACIPLNNGRVYTSLRVAGKPVANTLLADDSSTCSVSTRTFTRVQIGDHHRCVWGPPSTSKRGVGY